MNLDVNFSGATLLRDWWKKIKSNLQTIESEYNSHCTASELAHPEKSVKQKHIADKAVGTNQIADYCVGQTQLAQYSVSSAKIYPSAVQTAHIKDENVTKAKLEKTIQTQLDTFQEHVDNPSQEIADGAVTNDKIADGAVEMDNISSDVQSVFRNSKTLSETYEDETTNNLTTTGSDSLFKTFSSKYGTIKGAPSDTTVNSSGFIEYTVLTVPINFNDKIQFAVNTASLRCFVRRVNGAVNSEWTEFTLN